MNLVEIRKAKGMTQQDVASKAGIARESLSNIENGKRKPSVSVAKRIARVLDVKWAELFEDDENQPSESAKEG